MSPHFIISQFSLKKGTFDFACIVVDHFPVLYDNHKIHENPEEKKQMHSFKIETTLLLDLH